jgi:hypothetical protein
MSKDHFERILKLVPLTYGGNFLISCAFEPTLHPNFLEMLQVIPVHNQKKIAFTTNLSTNISDNIFETLSTMQLHHINISLESFKPEVYETCRRNAHYDHFISNLERLTYYFDKEPKSPPIRFITLVTRLNSQEIPDIIRRCHTQYHAFENEIRYPWTIPGPWNTPGSIDWIAKHALNKPEWDSLVASLVKIPFRYCVSHPLEESSNGQSKLRILWIRPDGLLLTTKRNVSNTFHLDSIENPFQFLKREHQESS